MDDATLMQRLSEEFINAQNSIERTRQELAMRLRKLTERTQGAVEALDRGGIGAEVDALAGIGEESLAIERLGRLFEEQREMIESAVDSIRGVTRRRLR